MLSSFVLSLGVLLSGPPSIEELKARAEALYNASVPQQQVVPEPLPEPTKVITVTKVQRSIPSTERLPRAVLFTAPYCTYCKQMIRELEQEGLTGGKEAPVQIVDTTRDEGFFKQYGITHSAVFSLPTVVIIDKDNKIHGWGENGFGCRLLGYKPVAQVKEYLSLGDHNVSLEIQQQTEDTYVADVPAGMSPLRALALHLAALDETAEQPVSSFFEFDIDAPEGFGTMLFNLVANSMYVNEDYGIKVGWDGSVADRTILLPKGTATTKFSPAPIVSYTKWKISLAVKLEEIIIQESGKQIVVVLSGAPDLTINLN